MLESDTIVFDKYMRVLMHDCFNVLAGHLAAQQYTQ